MTKSGVRFSDLVLHNDHQLIACNKPCGVPVQDDQSGDPSLMAMAQAYCKVKLFVVHRIDRPCSGVVVFAKNKAAAAAISDQFATNAVKKEYLAVVYKGLTEDGELSHYLAKSGPGKVRVTNDEQDGKEVRLRFEILAEIDTYTLLKVFPETGRLHQIRAQLAAMGYPIKGDVKYGFRRSNKNRSIHLHCSQLNFRHPTKQAQTTLVAEIPHEVVWNAFDFS